MSTHGRHDGRQTWLGGEMAIGIALGVALSVATGNWGLLAVGIAVGVALGAGTARRGGDGDGGGDSPER